MISVWEYLDEYGEERQEIHDAVGQVLASGRLILGSQVSQFESEFAAWCGAQFGIGVANGTDAIFLALRALGVGPGAEVITVANTAVPTVSAITATGATPVFVDIDPDTYLADVSQVAERITSATRVVLPVHLYGQTVDMDALASVVEPRGIAILEDCAQSHGAMYKGRKAGSMSAISAFSFYPTKILGTYGDGGMCLTGDADLRKKLLRLRFYGMEKTYYSLEQGYNSRLDELHAAILRGKLKHLDTYVEKRRALAARYDEHLRGSGYVLPKTSPDNHHAYYLYVVQHARREAVMESLASVGISLNISYPWPIHLQSGFAHLGYRAGSLPNTEFAASRIFSLPMFPSLSFERQDVVIEKLLEVDRGFS